MKCVVRAILVVLISNTFSHNAGAASPNVMCDKAAKIAASETKVPLAVLRSITRAETGRRRDGEFIPWPWTVNMEGVGTWFDTEDSARAYVFRHFKQGSRSFDIGCFQINYKWHGHAFASIEEMFDPAQNARYAASFLTSLHAELGSWKDAVGAYHSRTPKYANLYKARYEKIQAGLTEELADLPIETAVAENHFPLLRKQEHVAPLGSLVPLKPSDTRSVGLASVTGG